MQESRKLDVKVRSGKRFVALLDDQISRSLIGDRQVATFKMICLMVLLTIVGIPRILLAESDETGRLTESKADRLEQQQDPRANQFLKNQRANVDAYAVNSISFSPDGESLTYATWHEPVELRSTLTGDLVSTFRSPNHRPICVSMSPNGKYLATAGNNPHPRVKVWDISTGQVKGTLVGHPLGVRTQGIAWSPDSRLLVTVDGINCNIPGTALLWDLVKNQILDPD